MPRAISGYYRTWGRSPQDVGRTPQDMGEVTSGSKDNEPKVIYETASCRQCFVGHVPFPPCSLHLVTSYLIQGFLTKPCTCSHQTQVGPQWALEEEGTWKGNITCADNRQCHEELAQQELLAQDLLQVLLALHREALKHEHKPRETVRTEKHSPLCPTPPGAAIFLCQSKVVSTAQLRPRSCSITLKSQSAFPNNGPENFEFHVGTQGQVRQKRGNVLALSLVNQETEKCLSPKKSGVNR